MQPVVSPFHDTRSTADVLLAAASLPYADEFAFIQSKLEQFVPVNGGSFAAPEINTFMAYFQQHGGWWMNGNALVAPASSVGALELQDAKFEEGEFFLVPFVSPTLGEAGANKPWLQEAPDPTTTVMWNTWVEMNPATAHELGLENDDVVKLVSAAGVVEASVYLYPAIRPDTIGIPFGQGHTAYGRYASGRGVNPADLFSPIFNEAGDLAFAGVKVRVEKTGRKQVLSRLESKIGVYGEGLGE
jgi:formylmethanofuran dehydrogenase subunit D